MTEKPDTQNGFSQSSDFLQGVLSLPEHLFVSGNNMIMCNIILCTTRTGKTCTNFYDMHINQFLTCTSFHNYTTPQLHFKLHFTPDSCYYYKDRLGQSNKQILRSDD